MLVASPGSPTLMGTRYILVQERYTNILLTKGTAHRNKKPFYVKMRVHKCTNCVLEEEDGQIRVLGIFLLLYLCTLI